MIIDIDKNLEGDFLKAVQALRKDPSDIISNLLRKYLEDLYDYQEGLAGYSRYLDSGRQGTSLDDLKKEIGLDD